MFTNEKLNEYLDFFEDDTIKFYDFKNGYVDYHRKVDEFISDCYKSDMIDTEYLINLQGYLDKEINLAELVGLADMHLLKSILTYYIRGERFCDGMIADSFKDKVFEGILRRLIFIEENK